MTIAGEQRGGKEVRCLIDILWEWVRFFLLTVFTFFRKSLSQMWLNLSEAKSNDIVHPKTLVQKCSISIDNTRFRPQLWSGLFCETQSKELETGRKPIFYELLKTVIIKNVSSDSNRFRFLKNHKLSVKNINW